VKGPESTAGKVAPLRGFQKRRRRPSAAPMSFQPVAAVQSEYSLWTRDPRGQEVLPPLRGAGHRLRGPGGPPRDPAYLTGKVCEFEHRCEGLPGGNPRALSPPEAMKAKPGSDRGESNSSRRPRAPRPRQVALAWLLARGPSIVPIFGTRSPSTGVKENLGAAEVSLFL